MSLESEMAELLQVRAERDALRAEVIELRKESSRFRELMMSGEEVRSKYVLAVAMHGTRAQLEFLAGLMRRSGADTLIQDLGPADGPEARARLRKQP